MYPLTFVEEEAIQRAADTVFHSNELVFYEVLLDVFVKVMRNYLKSYPTSSFCLVSDS